MEIEEVLMGIDEHTKPIRDFLEVSTPSQIKERFQVQYGSGGPTEYYFCLCKLIKTRFADFQPEGMADWEAEQSEDHISNADSKLKSIVSEMREYIFNSFRSMYGTEPSAYWEKGIADKTVKIAAYNRALDTPVDERLALETYLEVLEMKKIVETKTVWPMFRLVFNIPEPGEKGQAKNLKWMERVNELRRIPAHPAKERKYKIEDFEYIDFIYEEFTRRLQEAMNTDLPAMPIAAGEDND